MSESGFGSRPRGTRGFYRDRENGWIFGVCAGIADTFNLRTCTVRLATVILLVLFFWPVVAIYVAATLLFREKPLIYAGQDKEHEFWRHRDRGRHWSHS